MADREVSQLYFARVSAHSDFIGSIVYSGEMLCDDSSVPFILGASVDGSSTTLHFYSISGDPLFRTYQMRENMAYRFEFAEIRSGASQMGKGFHRFLEKVGSELSMSGLIIGKLPFEKREGDLFVTREGYLYEGEGFSVVSDEQMRMVRADYRFNDTSIRLSYSYGNGENSVPSQLELFSNRCSVALFVERIFRRGSNDG